MGNNFPDLALGRQGLNYDVKIKELKSGVKHIKFNRGNLSPNDYHTLSSGIISKKSRFLN